MTHPIRKVLLVSALVLGAMGSVQMAAVPHAAAQQAVQRIPVSSILSRLDRLENEVVRLRQSAGGQGGDSTARIDQIEIELRRLTGLIERLEYETKRRADDADKRALDLETRLEALESQEPRGSVPSPQALAPRIIAPQPSVPSLATPQSFDVSRPVGQLGGGPAVAFGTPALRDAPPDLSGLPVQPARSVIPQPAPAQQGATFTLNTSPQPVPAQPAPPVPYAQPQQPQPEPIAVPLPTAQAAFAPSNNPQAEYDAALQMLNVGEFDQAGVAFEAIAAKYPAHPVAGGAKFWLGDMHLQLGRYNEAAKAFLESFKGWPEGPKAPDSLLKLGMTLAGLGQREEACLTFTQFPTRYPNASQTLRRRAEIEAQRTQCGG